MVLILKMFSKPAHTCVCYPEIKCFFEYSKTKSVFNSYTPTHLDYSCIIWGNCSCIIWGNCSCIIWGNCSCIIWGNCSESSGDKLIKFQKCVIVNKPTETPSAECFTKLRWMTFPERVHFQKALKAYKKWTTYVHSIYRTILYSLMEFMIIIFIM